MLRFATIVASQAIESSSMGLQQLANLLGALPSVPEFTAISPGADYIQRV